MGAEKCCANPQLSFRLPGGDVWPSGTFAPAVNRARGPTLALRGATTLGGSLYGFE